MTFIPRVKETAYLPHVTGSFAKRNEQADKLSDDFGKWLLIQSFRDKAQLTAEDLQGHYKKIYPNTYLEVTDKKSSNSEAYISSIGDFIDDKYIIEGHKINVPILKSKNNPETVVIFDDIYHENDHLSYCLVHPKILARESEIINNLGILKSIRLHYFYEKWLDNSKKISEKENLGNIKKRIKNFFKWGFFSSTQKVNSLQHLRYMLSSEDRAYNKTANFLMQNVELQNVNSISEKKTILEEEGVFDFEKRLYPQKIQLLNELLAEEIKDHRAKHAAKLRKRKRLKAGV